MEANGKKPANGRQVANGDAKLPSEVTFHYIKSNHFRVIHVDGAHGGPVPQVNAIQIALFSERVPIPQQITHSLRDHKLGDELSRVGRDGVVREVEAELIVSIDNAETLGKWILAKVEAARQAQGEGKQ